MNLVELESFKTYDSYGFGKEKRNYKIIVNVNDIKYITVKTELKSVITMQCDSFESTFKYIEEHDHVLHMLDGTEIMITESEYKKKLKCFESIHCIQKKDDKESS